LGKDEKELICYTNSVDKNFSGSTADFDEKIGVAQLCITLIFF
jgi:hypothetical protein